MRIVAVTLMGAALALLGCQGSSDLPPTYLSGLRVLAIKAEPPEAAPGGSSTVSVLAFDTGGAAPTASWSRCMRAPLAGQAVNPDCVTGAAGSDLVPIGDGLTVTAAMPDVAATDLGAPDATGGVYLPLVARVTTPAEEILSTYRLRLGAAGQPANANPQLAGLFVSEGGTPTAIDEATPLVVRVGDKLTLSATFTPGSAESYTIALPDGSGGTSSTSQTETLTVAWFATAGSFDNDKTSDAQPTTILDLGARAPAARTTVDLYAVGRDERGGTTWAHRTLQVE